MLLFAFDVRIDHAPAGYAVRAAPAIIGEIGAQPLELPFDLTASCRAH